MLKIYLNNRGFSAKITVNYEISDLGFVKKTRGNFFQQVLKLVIRKNLCCEAFWFDSQE